MKTFSTSRMTFLPNKWYAALGGAHHSLQGRLVVVAPTKKDVPGMLTDRGAGLRVADSMTASVTLCPRGKPLPTDLTLMIGAGVVDLDTPGVYAYHQGVRGDVIIKVLPGTGECVPVGRFTYERGALGVEAI